MAKKAKTKKSNVKTGEATETKTYTKDTSQELDEDTEVEDEGISEDDTTNLGKPEFKPIRTPSQYDQQEDENVKFEDLNKDVYDSVEDKKNDENRAFSSRYLILMRNGEQMNKVFPDWLNKNFKDGKWTPTDMNQPLVLPSRKEGPLGFENDPPLTEMGLSIATLIGKAFLDSDIAINHIYCSPALRCLQTANQIIKAQNSNIKIKVEPSFYDYFGNKNKPLPQFLSTQELLDNHLPVDTKYKQMMDIKTLKSLTKESAQEYFKRQANNIYNIVKHCQAGTILIIAHPFTIHSSGRGLLGRQILTISQNDLARIPFNYPYLSSMAFKPSFDGCWQIAPRVVPMLNLSHFSNRFNHFFFNKA